MNDNYASTMCLAHLDRLIKVQGEAITAIVKSIQSIDETQRLAVDAITHSNRLLGDAVAALGRRVEGLESRVAAHDRLAQQLPIFPLGGPHE